MNTAQRPPQIIAVTGSRNFQRLDMVGTHLESVARQGDTLRTGGAAGVDMEAIRTGVDIGMRIVTIRPDYNAFAPHLARFAPIARNGEIVNGADLVLAFWDGESRGTKDAIEKARTAAKRLVIIGPDGKEMKTDGT